MNDILKDVDYLKELIKDSKEYKEYKEIENKLDDNKEINEIVNSIKSLQKSIVSKKNNNFDDEEKLQELFDLLNSYPLYNEYIKKSKELNILLTKIQKRFEEEFNEILV